MKLLTIRLFIDGEPEENDERISFYRNSQFPAGTTEILYEPGDTNTTYRFWVTPEGFDRYINDLLESLTHDTKPFDSIQVAPATGPAIIYDVSELTETNVRKCVLNTVRGVASVSLVEEWRPSVANAEADAEAEAD
jgi:hypothetical protein